MTGSYLNMKYNAINKRLWTGDVTKTQSTCTLKQLIYNTHLRHLQPQSV